MIFRLAEQVPACTRNCTALGHQLGASNSLSGLGRFHARETLSKPKLAGSTVHRSWARVS